MNLPKIRTLRNTKIKLEKDSIEIQAWSNRDVVNFLSAQDAIDFDSLDSNQKILKNHEIIWNHLIKPNIITEYQKQIPYVYQKMVFAEMYKLSKGSLIDVQYKCSKCGQMNETVFDINKHFKFESMKNDVVEFDKFKFRLQEPTYDINTENDKYSGYRFLLSTIKYFEYDGKSHKNLTEEEIFDWCMDELDDATFETLVSEIQVNMSNVSYSFDGTCIECGVEELIVGIDLPDFGLVHLFQLEE